MTLIKKLNSYKLFRHSYTEPFEFYDSLIVIPNRIAKIIGLDVFSENYKVLTWNWFSLIMMISVYFYCTAITAYEVRFDTGDLIYCLVEGGIGIQGLAKIYTYLVYRKELVWIHQYTKQLYREACNAETKSMLMDNIFLLKVAIIVMLMCYAFTSISLITAPMLFSIMTGEKILPFGFYIPYLDRTEWFGYLINYAVHLYDTIYVSAEDMAADTIYMITMLSAFTQIDLLMMSLKETSQILDKDDENLQAHLNSVIKRHEEHLKYLRTVETVYRFYFFITFVSLASVLIMALFAVVTLSWYQGYIFVGFISYELFFGCFLGTLLDIKNEQLQHEIYQISWYKLSIPNQNALRFMLQASQEPICLTIIFAPLNMPTFLQVYKSIYSMFTMLLSFQEEAN
ncbi:putative odorant receptor 83c [Culex pipiens pallens]|uniref:putative odorant receptor 83c n=1 Tax=Culex pipiens pallens TaxID=42434 RepID=UPI001953D4C9|nr:putative odorant receptor 83c [Culex pipiens pallens]